MENVRNDLILFSNYLTDIILYSKVRNLTKSSNTGLILYELSKTFTNPEQALELIKDLSNLLRDKKPLYFDHSFSIEHLHSSIN